MKRFSGLFVCLAMVVATSVSSFAGYTGAGGSVGGYFGQKTPNTGNLSAAYTFLDNGLDGAFHTNGGGHSGDFLTGFGGVAFFTGTYNIGAASAVSSSLITFTSSAFGTFVGNVTSDSGNGLNTQWSRQLVFTGTFTPGTSDSYSGNNIALANTSFQITMSKSADGGSHSGNWTLDTTGSTPAAVPEPASLAIFGLGAVGFAARRFRRK
jgi:hypothetical protein